MRGAIPPLPNTPPRHGAQLKHRDNLTFTIILYCYMQCSTFAVDWPVSSGMSELQSKPIYKFLCMNHLLDHTLTITNMATVRSFKVIPDKFNVVCICTSGNYTHKRITKFNIYIYCFIAVATAD
jgi:hypothetical protein